MNADPPSYFSTGLRGSYYRPFRLEFSGFCPVCGYGIFNDQHNCPEDQRTMSSFPTIKTARLDLRPWREGDWEPFAALNADPRVMEFLPKMLDRTGSDALAARIEAHFERHGFGLWAVEVRGVTPFIGFVGLSVPSFEAHFTPCVEVGWRLAFGHWGRGYATEAAEAVRRFGFDELCLQEIVSFTVPENLRSRAVMERLGMTRSSADDFLHPSLPEGNRFKPHLLYRSRRLD